MISASPWASRRYAHRMLESIVSSALNKGRQGMLESTDERSRWRTARLLVSKTIMITNQDEVDQYPSHGPTWLTRCGQAAIPTNAHPAQARRMLPVSSSNTLACVLSRRWSCCWRTCPARWRSCRRPATRALSSSGAPPGWHSPAATRR